MTELRRIDPRVRAMGKARIEVTRRAHNERDWQAQWREPRFPFPFQWGAGWKFSLQYLVDDFAAEVGFYMDVLGFPAATFSPSFAQFTGPGEEFFLSIVAVSEGAFSTPPDAIRLQFRLNNLEKTVQELEKRGIQFDLRPSPDSKGDLPTFAVLRTPHGVPIELWGIPVNAPAIDELEDEFDLDDDEFEEEAETEDDSLIEDQINEGDEAESDGSNELDVLPAAEGWRKILPLPRHETPVLQEVKAHPVRSEREVTYENVDDKDDLSELLYQDEDEPIDQQPLTALVARGVKDFPASPAPVVRPTRPPLDQRRLEMPKLPDSALRKRPTPGTNQRRGTGNYPISDER